jgi:hypothetical protein
MPWSWRSVLSRSLRSARPAPKQLTAEFDVRQSHVTISKITYDDVSDRTLFALDLPGVEVPLPELLLPSKHFTCLLASDFHSLSDEQIIRLAEHLASSGACFFVCWGPGCERAHDLVDEVLVSHDNSPTEASVIMTTWHSDEALFFFLAACWPAANYFDSARSAVAVTVGAPAAAQQIRAALSDPREFVSRVSEEE